MFEVTLFALLFFFTGALTGIYFQRGERRKSEEDTKAFADDLVAAVGFIVGWFPGYESAILWGDDDMSLSDYAWGRAAQRLQKTQLYRRVLEKMEGSNDE